jgi:hypothetical protein
LKSFQHLIQIRDWMKIEGPTPFALDEQTLLCQIQQVRARRLIDDAERRLVLSDFILRVGMPQRVPDKIELTLVKHRAKLKLPLKLAALGDFPIEVLMKFLDRLLYDTKLVEHKVSGVISVGLCV